MTAARKFAFETEFSPDGRVLRPNDADRATLSREEAAALEQAAYERGRDDALVRAEEKAGEHLRLIASQMQFLLARFADDCAAMRRECAEAAVAAGEAMAGVALERFGREAVEAIAGEAVATLRDAAHIRIVVSGELVDLIRPRLDAAAEAAGFEGRLMIVADPARRAGDVEIIWADGVIASDRAAASRKIRAAAQLWLDDHAAGPARFDLFSEEDAR